MFLYPACYAMLSYAINAFINVNFITSYITPECLTYISDVIQTQTMKNQQVSISNHFGKRHSNVDCRVKPQENCMQVFENRQIRNIQEKYLNILKSLILIQHLNTFVNTCLCI